MREHIADGSVTPTTAAPTNVEEPCAGDVVSGKGVLPKHAPTERFRLKHTERPMSSIITVEHMVTSLRSLGIGPAPRVWPLDG